MAQPVNNTLQGGGLLTAPKTTAAAPINFGAVQNTNSLIPAPKPAAANINYSLPQPQMVTGLVNPPSSSPAQAAAPVKPLQTTTATQPAAPVAPATTTVPPAGTANGTQTSAPGLFPSVLSSIQGIAGNQTTLAQNAQDIANKYGAEIDTTGQQGASFEAGQRTTGTSPVAEGNAAVTAQTTAAQQSAEAAGESAALQGVQTGINANTAASTALGNVGSLTQPSATFPFVFDPATGTFTTSGGNLQTSISGGVQQAISNPTLYSSLEGAIQATYGQAAAGMFQQAFIQAGGNPSIAAGQATGAQALAAAPGQGQAAGEAAVIAAGGQTQAANIQTAGTASTSAASTAYQTATQAVSSANQTYSGLTGVASQLNDTLSSWHNEGLITNANQAINAIAGITSNPQYQQFVSALANTQAQYAKALGSAGVIPSQSTQDALSVLNPNSSSTAINAALNQLSKDAYAGIVAPPKQQQTIYAQQLGIQ